MSHDKPIETWPGEPLPLGAHWDGRGTNFSLFSEIATKVELCLFDEAGRERTVRLPEVTAFCWHGYLPGIGPGQRYAFRVHGPWCPGEGHRGNPAKVLLDPYTRAISGQVNWGPAVLPYVSGDPEAKNEEDSAPHVPRSVVIEVLNRLKLIAEPWDIGPGGYQVGNFPVLWSEWNGKYRDVTRDYWRSQEATLGEFAARLTGSADLYQDDGRKPYASINFITAHDGFTLRDLVSYNEKHNEANGEENHDGESHNRSWNLGAEGATDDREINATRARQQRNFLTTLLLSQGVPMILGGDEIGRTQQGNNNAYCQDSDISWFDWERADQGLLEFTRRLIAFRHDHPNFRRRGWFKGQPIRRNGASDIAWFKPDGTEMTDQDWVEWFAKSFMVFLNGDALRSKDERGRQIRDDSFLLLFNAHVGPMCFTLPGHPLGEKWIRVLDTTLEHGFHENAHEHASGTCLDLVGLSLQVLRKA